MEICGNLWLLFTVLVILWALATLMSHIFVWSLVASYECCYNVLLEVFKPCGLLKLFSEK